MVRRALLSLFPIILATLAILQGTPGAPAGESYADAVGVASPAAGVLSAVVVRGSLTEDLPDIPDIAVSQGADADDNSSALTVRIAVAVLWPQSTFEPRILEAGDRAGPNYWPCVAAPRAPPAV
jgi:hypothetical protein